MSVSTIENVIKKVRTAVNNLEQNKLETAKTLFWAKNVIVWKMTEYRSWTGFCRSELTLSKGTIQYYVRTAANIAKFKYSDRQCTQMMEQIGWTQFTKGLNHLEKRISVKAFIEKYRHFRFYTEEGDSVQYVFDLPARLSRKFDSYLEKYGMYIGPKGNRVNLNDSIIRFVQKELK